MLSPRFLWYRFDVHVHVHDHLPLLPTRPDLVDVYYNSEGYIFLHYVQTIFYLYVNDMVWWISSLYCDLLVTHSLAGIANSSYRHIQYIQSKLPVHALKDVHEDREKARQWAKDIGQSMRRMRIGTSNTS